MIAHKYKLCNTLIVPFRTPASFDKCVDKVYNSSQSATDGGSNRLSVFLSHRNRAYGPLTGGVNVRKAVKLVLHYDDGCAEGLGPDDLGGGRIAAVPLNALHAAYGGHEGFLLAYEAFIQEEGQAFRPLEVPLHDNRKSTIPTKRPKSRSKRPIALVA